MNRPSHEAFYDAFTQRTTLLTLKHFDWFGINVQSYKCNRSSASGLNWATSARIFITDTHIGINNYGIDGRFKRKFHYENYERLEELIDDLIPYMTNIVENHDGWKKRDREMKKYMKTVKNTLG